ncbi:MAG: aminopeptidase, partial [Candidatus Nanohaloarchaea archaeon]|nr:aminopeptidase [Candidatus Nanohaloarchaea archaeon]
MTDDQSDMADLEEKLSFDAASGWHEVDRDAVEEVADRYKEFLSAAKTEREAVDTIVEEAEEAGFSSLDELDAYEDGMKVYAVNRGKMVVLARLGASPDNARVTVSHVDSPRLDLKQQPLYEEADLALMDTHYYGGIKKYQWLNVPLALHGTVVDAEGEKHRVVIGEDKDDPVFLVPDLLPHLSKEQLKEELKDAIEGEDLNMIVGNLPVDDDEVEEQVKLQVLRHLHEEYGFEEKDLVSAEFEAVPAMEPRELGFDRSMIAAYGQDDRSCSFATMEAMLDTETEGTAIAVFVDKEEIGSEGNTSAQSRFLERFVSRLLELDDDGRVHGGVHAVMGSMEVLSTDVSAGVNPTFEEVHDTKNAMNLGQGVSLVKFTGSGGKYAANDAHAEFVGKVRRLLDEEDVPW